MRKSILTVALALVMTACGDDASVTIGATSPSTEAGTLTTAAPTTIATPTTPVAPSTTAAILFGVDVLAFAVLQDGDPWVVPIEGSAGLTLTIDDIWPLEGSLVFPDEHSIYEEAGFVEGSFGFFQEPESAALVLTGAHLFADPAGAATALAVLEGSFSDAELVAAITGLTPGALDTVFPTDAPGVGDDGVGVILTGPGAQVFGFVWITANLLQFVRVGMGLGDEARVEATVDLVRALAARVGG